MKHVRKSVLLWYSPHEMYELVTDVSAYPQFLPWCERAEIIEQDPGHSRASLHLAKLYERAGDYTALIQLLQRSADGQPRRVIGNLSDIDRRKRAELALRDSEQLFREIFDHAPIGLALIALDLRYLDVNHSLCRMLGYDEHELLQLRTVDLVPPDAVDEDRRLLDEGLAGQRTHAGVLEAAMARVAERIGLPESTKGAYVCGSYLHDLGKMGAYHLTALNVAEYEGLVAGLQAVLDLDLAAGAVIEVRMDSKLVVEQMSGRWKIKHADMQKLAGQARAQAVAGAPAADAATTPEPAAQ